MDPKLNLFIVDATGWLYRSYFAIRGMSNRQGESTGALFGFIRALHKLMRDFSPTHLVCVFDGPRGNEKRRAIYPNYKGHRKPAPDDLRAQIELAKTFCNYASIPEITAVGVEADDVMGSIAHWAENNGLTTFLCSSDKDLCQLVSDKVFMLNVHKDNQILDKEKVCEKFGVYPEQIIDYLAIAGDAADNIPGLAGFGGKTAAKLLTEFHSLEALLASPEKVKGAKKQETLREGKEAMHISRQLVTILTDVEIPFDTTAYALSAPDQKALAAFYDQMDFHSLRKELQPEETKEDTDYKLINSIKELNELIAQLSHENEIAFDTETTSVRPMEASLVGIGFSIASGKAYYIPLNGDIPRDVVIDQLKPLFANKTIGFYGHNVKYDWHVLKNEGIEIVTLSFDTMIASYILNSESRQHSLDALSLHFFNKVKTSITSLIGVGKQQITIDQVDIKKVCDYCCEDVDYTFRLKQHFNEELKNNPLSSIFFDLELPLLKELAKMERRGIYLDLEKITALKSVVLKEISLAKEKIFSLAGEEFNLNSPKQLGEVLFIRLGIPSPKKTKTGYSTDASVLELLAATYPIAEDILNYRQLEKLRSTYIETLPLEVHAATKRIHPTFSQSTAATGRLSCQNPNLQNIPVRTELGRKIRSAFTPQQKGYSFIAGDYSQIELRLLAHMSRDPILEQAFIDGEDIHTATAAALQQCPIEAVSREMRYAAKAVNFGILYGQQAFGLARELKISQKEAKKFIDTYFDRYKKVKEYIEVCKDKAKSTGKTVTLFGRERPIPEINSKNGQMRSMAERLAVNTPIQGTAADLIKQAMLDVASAIDLEGLKGKMLLQVHDELIFEVPDEELQQFSELVKIKMEQVMQLTVPLVVNISIGKNWGEC